MSSPNNYPGSSRSFLIPSQTKNKPTRKINAGNTPNNRKVLLSKSLAPQQFSAPQVYGATAHFPEATGPVKRKSGRPKRSLSIGNANGNGPSYLDDLHFHSNISDIGNLLESNYDFDSHPSSSDNNSDDSSLDDVCLPINDSNSVVKNWPDLSVLQEFYEEESKEALLLSEADKQNIQSAYSTTDDFSENPTDQSVVFQYPLISKIDTPFVASNLAAKKVNEASIKGPLRPPKFSPWDKSNNKNLKNYLPNDFPQDAEKKFEQFRYTYFRPSLEATIHAPTISGLLQDGQSFADLFVVSQYSTSKMPPSIIKQKSRINVPDSTGTSNSSAQRDGTATPKSAANAPLDHGIPADPVPFWLDVLDPTEEEMKVLSKAFGIHPLTTEDIFLNEAREKVELFKDYYFVCFRSFDIVQERLKRKAMNEKLSNLENSKLEELQKNSKFGGSVRKIIEKLFNHKRDPHDYSAIEAGQFRRRDSSIAPRKQKVGKYRELEPLNFYIIVFHDGVLTFHFSPTPHPVTVRRRARLLKDYLTVSSDWIAYALIDDITDAFGPMIETIEEEVYSFEDAILKLHSGGSSDTEESDSENDLFYHSDRKSLSSNNSSMSSSSYLSTSSAEWQRKGDMLRRIGECRKRIMTLLRLLGSKADVIKGLAKRCNENFDVAPRSEIGMYLGDIQDHIITMVQSLNHYEKLLARSHSNYLAQINIDMTKVNNDMNDVLGKITILGTIVLPMNVITGLWGMNVLVPGQDMEGLTWFFSILGSMLLLAIASYFITLKLYNF